MEVKNRFKGTRREAGLHSSLHSTFKMPPLCACQDLHDIKETLGRIEGLLLAHEREVPDVPERAVKVATKEATRPSVDAIGFTSAFYNAANASRPRHTRCDDAVLSTYDVRRKEVAYTISPGADYEGYVSFSLAVPHQDIITDIELMGPDLTKIMVLYDNGHQTSYDWFTLGDEISALNRRKGVWLHLMDFLGPIPWFAGTTTIMCVSSGPVSIRYSVATLPSLPPSQQTVTTSYRALSKCGEGIGGDTISLHTTQPTLGLLLVPPKAYQGPVPSSVSLNGNGSNLIYCKPVVARSNDDMFHERAFWIRFPCPLDMTTMSEVLLWIDGANECRFTISSLHIKHLRFACGATSAVKN